MIVKFDKGDIVRDVEGSLAKINDVTVLYTLDNGKVWNEDGLNIVKKMNNDISVVERLCSAMDVDIPQLTSQNRKRFFVIRRQAIAYVLRYKYGWTYQHMGLIMKRDHATMISGVNHFSDLLTTKDKDAVSLYKMLILV